MALSLNDRSAGSGSAAASNRGSAGHVALLSAAHVGRLVMNLCIAVCGGGKHDLSLEASLLYHENGMNLQLAQSNSCAAAVAAAPCLLGGSEADDAAMDM